MKGKKNSRKALLLKLQRKKKHITQKRHMAILSSDIPVTTKYFVSCKNVRSVFTVRKGNIEHFRLFNTFVKEKKKCIPPLVPPFQPLTSDPDPVERPGRATHQCAQAHALPDTFLCATLHSLWHRFIVRWLVRRILLRLWTPVTFLNGLCWRQHFSFLRSLQEKLADSFRTYNGHTYNTRETDTSWSISLYSIKHIFL